MEEYKSISHPAKTKMVCIREDYLGICQTLRHPHCAAALLNMFERWFDWKSASFADELRRRQHARNNNQDYDPAGDLWVFMSQSQMKDELQGLFGDKLIANSLQDLTEAGFIKSRRNPKNSWDRTLQYLFLPNTVQGALNQWENMQQFPYRKIAVSKAQKCVIETAWLRNRNRKIAEAIPQSQTLEPITETKAPVVARRAPTMQEADAAIFTAAAAVDGLPKVVLAYEQNIGVVTPMIRDKLIAAIDDYTEQWIIDAIDEAVSNNVRKWNYCNSILERWHNEGRKPKQTNGSAPTKTTGMDFSAKLAEMGITPDSPEYTDTINRLMAEHYAERERRAQAMHAKQFEKVAS